MKQTLSILILTIFLTGCDSVLSSKPEIKLLEGELAPNLRSLNDGEPLKGIWRNIHNTYSHEIWVDSTNQIVVFRQNGMATLVYSDVDGAEFVDLFNDTQHLLTAEVTDGNDRLIVYKESIDGDLWWYIDKDFDGVVDTRFIPNTNGAVEELESKKFIKVDKK